MQVQFWPLVGAMDLTLGCPFSKQGQTTSHENFVVKKSKVIDMVHYQVSGHDESSTVIQVL